MAIAGAKTTPLAALPPSEKRPNVLLAALGVRIADRFEKIIEAFPPVKTVSIESVASMSASGSSRRRTRSAS